MLNNTTTPFNPLFCTLSPASSVSHSCKGSFITNTTSNLVVTKPSSIDLYTLSKNETTTTSQLVLVNSTDVFCRIALIANVKPTTQQTDTLFVLSHALDYAFMTYDLITCTWLTVDHGTLVDRTGRKLHPPYLSFVDSANKCLGLVLHQGILSVLPFPSPSSAMASGSSNIGGLVPNKKQKQKLGSSSLFSANTSSLISRFTVRMHELNVLSLTYLNTSTNMSTFALLCQDVKGQRHVRSYCLNLSEKDLKPGPIPQFTVSRSAHMIVALESGSMLVFDHRSIMFVAGPSDSMVTQSSSLSASENDTCSKPCKLMRDSQIKTFSFIDEHRLIVGDLIGNYTLVHIVPSHSNNTSVTLEAYFLGSASPCTTLTYIESGLMYLGSQYGNSILLQLHEHANSDGSNMSIVTTYNNIGPITDFVVMDVPGNNISGCGTKQIVTCSGAFNDGSLRVIKHGIELQKLGCMPLSISVTRILSATYTDVPGLIAISFTGATSVFLTVDPVSGNVSDLQGTDLITDDQTLAIAFLDACSLVQVTPTGVYLFRTNPQCTAVHKLPFQYNDTAMIRHALVLVTDLELGVIAHVVLALNQELVQLVIRDTYECTVSAFGVFDLQSNIACIDVDPDLGLAAIGLWDRSILLYTWPAWNSALASGIQASDSGTIDLLVDADTTPVNVFQGITRSLVLASFRKSIVTVLAARANGTVVAYELDVLPNGHLKLISPVPRTLTCATEPVRLVRVMCRNVLHVFGACKHPVLFKASESGKVSYSDVNMFGIRDVCTVPVLSDNGDQPWDALFVVTVDELIISTMDQVENVHTSTIPLGGEMPRRILHHADVKALVILTEKLDDMKSTSKPIMSFETYADELAYVRVLDELSMEVVATDELQPNEAPQCICLHRVPNEADALVAVGTAFIVVGEEEPSKGRVLVYRLTRTNTSGCTLGLVSSTTVKGAVYALASISSDTKGLLVAGINNRVTVLSSPKTFPSPAVLKSNIPITSAISQDSAPNYTSLYTASGFITALYLDTYGDLIVVGDLMKSVTLFTYDRDHDRLEVVAKDPSPSWVTAVTMIDGSRALVSDAEHNVYVTQLTTGPTPCVGGHAARIEVPTEFHLGHFVNKFQRGYLRAPSDDARVLPMFLSGSVDGRLGMMAHVVCPIDYEKLVLLNLVIGERVNGVGQFAYTEYRKFQSPRKSVHMHGVVDGDFLCRFLEMDVVVQEELVRVVESKLGKACSVSDVVLLVEDVVRLRRWFDCPACHQELSDHPLRKTVELIFACKKCRKVFRKDVGYCNYDEQDEYCPHCDNKYVIDAVSPEFQVGFETDDLRQNASIMRDDRVKPKDLDQDQVLDQYRQAVAKQLSLMDQAEEADLDNFLNAN